MKSITYKTNQTGPVTIKKNHMDILWHNYTDKKDKTPILRAPLPAKASIVGRVGIMMLACGTGACAAVAAAIENGLCSANETVTVKTRGGDLFVKYTYDNIFLTGNAEMIFTGTTEF